MPRFGGAVRAWRHIGRSVATRQTPIEWLGSGQALGYVAELGYDGPDGAPWDMAKREQLIFTEAAALADAGTTIVHKKSYGVHLGHVVMLDPEGNEFYVPSPPDRRDRGPVSDSDSAMRYAGLGGQTDAPGSRHRR
jgi:hypothetical protein